MNLSTDNMERPAMSPTAAPVGALGAVSSDQSAFCTALGTARGTALSAAAGKPMTHQEWVNRPVDISTTARSARLLGSPPT